MAVTMPVKISREAQDALASYIKTLRYDSDMRDRMTTIDISYARESDRTRDTKKSRTAHATGDISKLENIEMAITSPAVEAGVTYQSSVFLTGYPMFGVTAAPQYIDQALQLETVIDNQANQGRWSREFMLAFRDLFKYNLCLMEVTWKDTVTQSIETDIQFSATQGKPKEVIYSGNCLKRLNPYNSFWDMTVAPADLHVKGEYAGYIEGYSKVQLKQFLLALPDGRTENYKRAYESSSVHQYHRPSIRNDISNPSGTDWFKWAGIESGNNTRYSNYYEVRTIYCRIIPEDFGMNVPAKATPQIWKFIFVNDDVLVYSERQTNAHGFLPVICAQAVEDGLDYQTKSMAESVMPLQRASTALMTSVLAARRRAISDRGIYDPSRISEAHINNPNPSAKIPVRPAAYGENVANSYYAIPFRDDQSPILMQEIAQFGAYANAITGQNPARQGQFVKGNKTLHEFDTVMNNANGRDQLTAILIEHVLMAPIKEIIKINILQYQGAQEAYNRGADTTVQVDPVALRNAVMEFKISDGLTPKDKMANTDSLSVAMQVLGSSPQIAQAYNIAPLFSYIMKLQGATELKSFEKSQEQIAYEQAVQQWQQVVMQAYKDNPELKAEQLPPQPKPADYGVQQQAPVA